MKRLHIIAFILIVITITVIGCNRNDYPDSSYQSENSSKSEQSGQSETISEISSTVMPSASETEPASDEATSKETEFDPESIKIALYNGVGVWDLNVIAFENYFNSRNYTFDKINQNDLLDSDILGKYDLVWFPGGYSAEYKFRISSVGQKNLIDYVDNGGYFAGSCAGAYFASEIMTWYGEDSSYPLKIFSGKAVGPLAGLVPWGGISVSTINKDIYGNDLTAKLPINYFDGPYFVPDENANVDILARYDVNNEAAVIAGSFGNGKFLLFGPHPELGTYNRSTDNLIIDGGDGSQWEFLDLTLKWVFN